MSNGPLPLRADRLRFVDGLGLFDFSALLTPELSVPLDEPCVLRAYEPQLDRWAWPRTGDLDATALLPVFVKLLY